MAALRLPDIIAQLKEHPKSVVSLCPNDGGYSSFCQCEECKKLDAPNAPKVKMLVFAHVGGSERTEIGYDMEADKRRFHVTDTGIVIVVRQESLIEEPETQ